MNNRIIIDSKPSDFKRTWYVKFNEKTGKIIRVANKPMTEDPHAGVLVTETQNKELVGGLTSGKINKRTIGIIWDPVNEKYDLSIYEENLKVIKNTEAPIFNFDATILLNRGLKEDKNLGNAISFLKQRWLANNYVIREKDIDDAVQLFK